AAGAVGGGRRNATRLCQPPTDPAALPLSPERKYVSLCVVGVLCGRPGVPSHLGMPHVGERQLDEGLSIVMVRLERKRDVDRGSMLGEILVALGGAPGDGAEDAAVLLQRHLQ